MTPDGTVYYASLAGSYVGRIDPETGEATVLEPPTSRPGRAPGVVRTRKGRVWVSEWDAGQVGDVRPGRERYLAGVEAAGRAAAGVRGVRGRAGQRVADRLWRERDRAIRPVAERFETFPLPHAHGNVRQILGRAGEVWAPEWAADRLVVVR